MAKCMSGRRPSCRCLDCCPSGSCHSACGAAPLGQFQSMGSRGRDIRCARATGSLVIRNSSSGKNGENAGLSCGIRIQCICVAASPAPAGANRLSKVAAGQGEEDHQAAREDQETDFKSRPARHRSLPSQNRPSNSSGSSGGVSKCSSERFVLSASGCRAAWAITGRSCRYAFCWRRS
jgi:hypothetical protein